MKNDVASEPIMLMFAHLGIQYKNVAIAPEDFELERQHIKGRRVPALRIHHKDGTLEWLNESKGIVRALGTEHKLLGRNDLEMYYVDRVLGKVLPFTTSIKSVISLPKSRHCVTVHK